MAREKQNSEKKASHPWLGTWLRMGPRGIAIGMANAIPGVSGGTIAVVTGIYQEVIDAFSDIFKGPTHWRKAFSILVPLLVGLGLGLVGFARVVDFMYTNVEAPTNLFFIGLIAGSLPFLGTQAFDKRFKWYHIFGVLIALGLMVWMGLSARPEYNDPMVVDSFPEFALLAGAGFVSVAAMVIPGISGSFLLLTFGLYSTFIASFKSFIIPNLITFIVGGVLGAVLLAKGISWLLKRAHSWSYSIIFGLVTGSLVAIWPRGETTPGDWVLGTFLAALGVALALSLGHRTKGAKVESRPQTKAIAKGILRVTAAVGGVVLMGILVLSLISSPRPPAEFFSYEPGIPLDNGRAFSNLAHQGGNLEYPDATLLAFDNALESGAQVLELDVALSADGQLMVIHDLSIDRTTNGSGLVSDLAAEEIQSYDAAYWWPFSNGGSPDGEYPYRGQGVTVPRLEEVFVRYPGMPMLIEMKSETSETIDALGELIRRYGREERTMVGSFHHSALELFRDRYPEISTSASEEEVRSFVVFHLLGLGKLYPANFDAFQVPVEAEGIRLATERFIEDARSLNVAVHVWTINDRETMEELVDLGVDGIITDRPSLLTEVMIENGADL